MEAGPQMESALVREISGPLAAGQGWIKFVGILMIVVGALIALTIIGIVFAWLPIWMGVLLYQTASLAQSAHETGQKFQISQALAKLKTYFTIMGIMIIVAIVLDVLFIVFAMAAGILTSTAGQ